MKNINNNTEHKLKQRLVEHEFDFDPQAWKSLNKKLNQHNPRRSPLWVSSLLMLTALVTTLSVAWYVPLEPIQKFFEETFDIQFQEDNIREKTIHIPLRKIEIIEAPQERVFENNNIPTKSNRQQIEESPALPLPKMGPYDLLEMQENEIQKENQSLKPIAGINSYVQDEDDTVTSINLPMKSKIHAGFFGGGSVAVSNSPLIPEGAVSPGIGVFAGYNINDKWGVQAEINFRKGFIQPFTPKEEKDEFLTLPVPVNINSESTALDRVVKNKDVIARNLTVLEFPVLAKYKLNEKHSVMAGVRPSWIYVKDPNSDNSTTDANLKAIYEKWDVGLSVGYEVQLSKRIAVNFRYNQGVSDMFEENDDTYLNNDFQASVRYTLNP